MTYEILYTSAPQGLKPGSFGFCTVAASEGIPPPLLQRLESLSSYRHLYPPGHPRAALNPVNYAHLLVQVGGRRLHVLSRIADAGWDYSQRTNKLAHHVVLEESECIPPGPAWLLAQPGFCLTQFSGSPRILPPNRPLPPGELLPARCVMWEQVTGDAGWAGVLVRQALEKKQSAYLIFREGMELLPLLLEAQALLPPKERWEVTFSTYYTRLPPGVDCLWRCVLTGSAEAQEAQTARSAVVLDLTRPLGPAPNDPWTQAARDGLPAPRELLPASPSVGSSSSLLSMAAAGTIPPAPWDSSSPPLDLPGWSGIEPVSAADRNGLMAPPAPPPLAASRRSSWLAMAGGLLLGLFLGAAGAVIVLRSFPPDSAVAQTTPKLAQKPATAEHSTQKSPPGPSPASTNPTSSAPNSNLSSGGSKPTSPDQPSQPTPANDSVAHASNKVADPPKSPSDSSSLSNTQARRNDDTPSTAPTPLGWPLDQPLTPGREFEFIVANDLPEGTTLEHIALLPETREFKLEPKGPSAADVKWLPDPYSSSSTAVATLTLKDGKLRMTWGQRIDIDKSSQKILSYVIQYRDRSSPSSDSPRLYPIWQVYDIAAPLSLRHCFKGKPLYSFDNSAKQLTPTAFPADSMYFQFRDARIQNLFGPTHDNSNSTLFDRALRYLFGPTHDNSNSTFVDGVLRSDPKTKASDGARWDHVTDNSFYYHIRLKPQEETYVITGEYMHGAFDTTEKEQIPAHLSRLRSILKDGDASRLSATQNVITLLTRGFEVAARLDTKQKELQKKPEHDITDNDIRDLAELYDDVGKWIERVKKAIEESQIVLQRTQLDRFENAVATQKNGFDGIIKTMDASSKTSGRPTKGNESKRRSPPIAGKLEKVEIDVTKLKDLVGDLYLAWLDTDSPTSSAPASIDEKVVEDLKRFESSILTRARMSAESAGNSPQVGLVLCRRVEWKDERTKETQEAYLPVVRFGEQVVP